MSEQLFIAGRDHYKAVRDGLSPEEAQNQYESTAAGLSDQYADAVKEFHVALSRQLLQPSEEVAPLGDPVVDERAAVRVRASTIKANADRTYSTSVAEAEERFDGASAEAWRIFVGASIQADRIAGLDRLDVDRDLRIDLAGFASNYRGTIALATADYEVAAWAALAAVPASPTDPLQGYHAQAAEANRAFVVAVRTLVVAGLGVPDPTFVREMALANAEYDRESTKTAAQSVYAVVEANADQVASISYAQGLRQRLSSEAFAEAALKTALLNATAEWAASQQAADNWMGAVAANERFTAESAAAEANAEWTKSDRTGDDWRRYQSALEFLNKNLQRAAGSALTTAHRYLGEHYDSYINALAGAEVALARASGDAELTYTTALNLSDDFYEVTLSTAAGTWKADLAAADQAHEVASYTVWAAFDEATAVVAASRARSLVGLSRTRAATTADAAVDYHLRRAADEAADADDGSWTERYWTAYGEWLGDLRAEFVHYKTFSAGQSATSAADRLDARVVSIRSLHTPAQLQHVESRAAARRDLAVAEFGASQALSLRQARNGRAFEAAKVGADALASTAGAEARADYARDVAAAVRARRFDALGANHSLGQTDADEEKVYQRALGRAEIARAGALGSAATTWTETVAKAGAALAVSDADAAYVYVDASATASTTAAGRIAAATGELAVAQRRAEADQWYTATVSAANLERDLELARIVFEDRTYQVGATAAASFVGSVAGGVGVASLQRATASASNPSIHGVVEQGAAPGFVRVEIDLDGVESTIEDTTVAGLDGRFLYTPSTLAPGSYTLRARTVYAGAVSPWTSLPLTVAAPGPGSTTVALATATGDDFVATAALTGTTAAGATVDLDWTGDGVADLFVVANEFGRFEAAPALGDGWHVVAARTSGGDWSFVSFVVGSDGQDLQALEGWTTFVAERAAARADWSSRTALLDAARARHTADLRTGAAWETREDHRLLEPLARAETDRARNSAVAAAKRQRAQATADKTFARDRAAAEADYRRATAAIEQQYVFDRERLRIVDDRYLVSGSTTSDGLAAAVEDKVLSGAEASNWTNVNAFYVAARDRRDQALEQFSRLYNQREGLAVVALTDASVVARRTEIGERRLDDLSFFDLDQLLTEQFTTTSTNRANDAARRIEALDRAFAADAAEAWQDVAGDWDDASSSPWAAWTAGQADADGLLAGAEAAAADLFADATAAVDDQVDLARRLGESTRRAAENRAYIHRTADVDLALEDHRAATARRRAALTAAGDHDA
ncbi:MAG: hypothetical protein ACRC1K_24390, partial [Planctomycetia bacterium]